MAGKSDDLPTSQDVARVALATLRSNARLNLSARILLLVFALASVSLAVVFAYGRADETVSALTDPKRDDEIATELLALTAPVLLLVVLSALAAVVGYVVHSRGLDESVRTLDSINRLRREKEVAVSARGLMVAFDDQLASIKRSHSVVVWAARTLFIVTLGLFAACVIQAIATGVDTTTLVLGATSLAGALFGVVQRIPNTVAHQGANVVQMQLIVTGAHRQISMLESDAFASLNNRKTPRADAHKMVMRIQRRLDDVVRTATAQVEQFADDPPRHRAAAPVAKAADVVPINQRAAA
jgi:hypothetical protein